jgi:predicted TIM-barrel fold metal-dependent hydrolase
MMLGTHYPFWKAPASGEALAGAGLPAETASGIESDNAECVLGLAG